MSSSLNDEQIIALITYYVNRFYRFFQKIIQGSVLCPEFRSDYIVISCRIGLIIQNVLESDAVKIVAYHFLKPLPHRQSCALAAAGTAVGLVLKTGNRRQTSLGRTEDLPHAVILRSLSQAVSALKSAGSQQQFCPVQGRQYLFEILFRYILPTGDVLQRDIAVLLVLGKVEHHAQRISAACRDHL